MNSLAGALAASFTTFAATNIDDIVLLTFFFANRVPTRRIVAGQYLGFAATVVISLIGVWAAQAIPEPWIRLLGLLPLALGIKKLFDARDAEEKSQSANLSTLAIALITLANGADNVGVYIPFFVIARNYLWVVFSVYAVLIAALCLLSKWIGNRPAVLRAFDKWGHWAVPAVFIGLGIYILAAG